MRKLVNNLIPFAIKFEIKPNVIKNTGPIIPITATIFVIVFFVPSLKLLKLVNIFPINSAIGVTALRNCSPIGARVNLRSSILFLNFVPVASSTFFNSRSERTASSSTDALLKSNALAACVPSFVMF